MGSTKPLDKTIRVSDELKVELRKRGGGGRSQQRPYRPRFCCAGLSTVEIRHGNGAMLVLSRKTNPEFESTAPAAVRVAVLIQRLAENRSGICT